MGGHLDPDIGRQVDLDIIRSLDQIWVGLVYFFSEFIPTFSRNDEIDSMIWEMILFQHVWKMLI